MASREKAKLRFVAIIVCALLGTSGCDALRRETEHPGGFFGNIADTIVFPATTKEMQAFRGLVVGAALARIAERHVTSETDAVAVVGRINGVGATVTRLHALAISRCEIEAIGNAKADQPCDKNLYTTAFEAKVPDLYAHIFRLAANGLPREEFSELIKEIGSGDLIGSIWAVLDIGKEAAISAHYAFAVGRQSTEARAIALLDISDEDLDKEKKEKIRKLIQRNSISRSDEALRTYIDYSKHDLRPGKVLFFAVFSVMHEACLRVEKKIDKDGIFKGVRCDDKFLGVTVSSEGFNPNK